MYCRNTSRCNWVRFVIHDIEPDCKLITLLYSHCALWCKVNEFNIWDLWLSSKTPYEICAHDYYGNSNSTNYCNIAFADDSRHADLAVNRVSYKRASH